MDINNFQKNIIKEKGITLVSLVITIVILIILTTITLSVGLGEKGLIRQTEDTKNTASNTITAEEEEMNEMLAKYTNIMREDSKIPLPPEQITTPIEEVTKGKPFDKTRKISDESGDIFYVPGGFGIAEDSPNEIDDGIVITNEENTKQFVWIPVNDASLAKMYNTTGGEKQLTGVTTKTSIYSNLRVRSGDSYTVTMPGNESGIREPDVLSSYDTDAQYYNAILGYESTKEMADAMVEEYSKTYESIKKYDGFYIGRFELTGSVENPTVQKDKTVLTDENWYELKKACSNVVSTKYVQSTMIYGNQWDEVMNWLIATGEKTAYQVNTDSAAWGNYEGSTGAAATNSGIEQTSGKNEAWQANNIYDLAGNCIEMTQEACKTNTRVYRGGDYYGSGSSGPASDRYNGYNPDYSVKGYTSRPALYLH